MQIDLSGKVAIVTGAGRGIGREIATTLASEGVTVVAVDLREAAVAELRNLWSDRAWPGAQLVCDVRSKPSCHEVVSTTVDRFGRIDILVNNAGVAAGGLVETLDEDVWDANFDANIKGVFLMCQAVVPQMKSQGSGRIVNSSSFAAIVPSMGGSAYAASKAGVHSLTRVLAGELGPHEITVNCIAPGMIPTQMNRFTDASDARKEALLDTLSLRRWGDAADVARLVCFLSSDLAGYITGSLIDISGGKLATQMPWMAYRETR